MFNIGTIVRLVSYLCSGMGVRVKSGENWAYDMENKVITYNPRDLYRMSNKEITGMVMHEVGHVHFSRPMKDIQSVSDWNDKYPSSSHMAMNAFEDMRIEEMMRKKYPHANRFLPRGGISKDMMRAIYSRFKSYQDHENKSFEIPKLVQYCLAASLYAAGQTGEARSLIDGSGEQDLIDAFNKTYMHFNPCFSFETDEELGEYLDKNIFPHIEKFMEESEQDQESNDLMQQINGGHGDGDEEGSGHGACVHEEPMTNAKVFDRTYDQIKSEVKSAIKPLTSELNKVLKDTSFDRYHGSYTSGKLNRRSIHKTENLETRIFNRKVENKNKYYEFGVLVDYSSSMNGNPFYEAINGMVLLEEALGDLPVIKTALMGFSNDPHMIKPMSVGTDKSAVEKFQSHAKHNMGGTNDRKGLEELLKQFTPNKNTKRVAIMLTDGMSGSDVKHALRKYKQAGIVVYVVGIGIDEEYMNDEFDHKIAVDNVYELPRTFAQIAKKTITRV